MYANIRHKLLVRIRLSKLIRYIKLIINGPEYKLHAYVEPTFLHQFLADYILVFIRLLPSGVYCVIPIHNYRCSFITKI